MVKKKHGVSKHRWNPASRTRPIHSVAACGQCNHRCGRFGRRFVSSLPKFGNEPRHRRRLTYTATGRGTARRAHTREAIGLRGARVNHGVTSQKSAREVSLRGRQSWHHTRSKCHLVRVVLERRRAPAARQLFPAPVQSEEIAATEARSSPGTIRPNTRIDAPQPQKDRGHPAGGFRNDLTTTATFCHFTVM